MEQKTGTKFSTIYNRFLEKITDDMYMELTPEDTVKDLQKLLNSTLADENCDFKSTCLSANCFLN